MSNIVAAVDALLEAATELLLARQATGIDDSKYFARLERAVISLDKITSRRYALPDLNHSLLSPSGSVSKSARAAALKRLRAAYQVPLTREQRLKVIAASAPELESTQAARRLLAKAEARQ